MSHKVYLAGPIAGLSYGEAVDWREQVKTRFFEMSQGRRATDVIVGLSPMRGKTYLANETSIQGSYDKPLSTNRAIVTRDGWDIRRCDLLLVNLLGAKRPTIGTVWELGVAWALNKPVLLVIDHPNIASPETNNVHHHPMVLETAGWIVHTLEEAMDIIGHIARDN